MHQKTDQTITQKEQDLLAIIANYESKFTDLQNQNIELKSQLTTKDLLILRNNELILQLQEQLKRAYANRYGRTSERYENVAQIGFFDEMPEETKPEQDLPAIDDEAEVAAEVETKEAQEKQKKKTGRKKLPDYLPREELICALPESELSTEEGYKFSKIGEEISEHLEVIPASVKVIRVIRYKYACRDREEYGIKLAPSLANQAIPKSIAGNGMIAHMLVQKFCYHLPFYRQQQIWKDLEVEIPRATMCNWACKVSELFEPMMNVLKKEIFSSGYIHADETPVTVLDYKEGTIDRPKNKDDPRDKKTSKCFMWVYGNSLNKLVMFDYQKTRSGSHANDFLKGFTGYIQADAYSGYDQVYNKDRIEVACMAHARRKFADILKIDKKHTHANYAMREIQRLYAVEKDIKDLEAKSKDGLSFDEIKKIRLDKAKSVLEELFRWMENLVLKTPPKGSLGIALNYSLKNRKALARYLDEGFLDIDNNFAERAIRPFTLGRKNWLFCGNHDGAKSSAIIYSLLECAKAYDLKPYDYLKYLLDNIKPAMPKEELKKLLPHLVKMPSKTEEQKILQGVF
jgi:transposase